MAPLIPPKDIYIYAGVTMSGNFIDVSVSQEEVMAACNNTPFLNSSYYQLRDRNDTWKLVATERDAVDYSYIFIYSLDRMKCCPDFDF